MKPLLALVTLVLTSLLLEEKARQVAGDAQQGYNELAGQARQAKDALTEKVERQPLISLLIAGGVAYALATMLPARD